MHLENSLIMYRVYNAETLSKLVKTVQVLHSHQMLVKQLFTGQQVATYQIYSKMQDTLRNKFIIISPNYKRKIHCGL